MPELKTSTITVSLDAAAAAPTVAAAFLKAESYENASNYAKSSAGKKAKARIANGENYITVIADMEAKRNEHTVANMWN